MLSCWTVSHESHLYRPTKHLRRQYAITNDHCNEVSFANFIRWGLRWIFVRDTRLNDPVKTRQRQIKVDHGCYQKCRWKVSEGPNKVALEQFLYVRTVYG